MMYRLIVFFLLGTILGAAQNDPDNSYLEDQFYLGTTYNFLLDRPTGVEQRNLSYGLQLGYIKDMPISLKRNIGFGIGLGYAVNSYYSNLVANESAGAIAYTILDNANTADEVKRSKIETHLVEVPIEFRWRTSTASEYKFWRIYTGIKFGYVLGGRSKYVSDSNKNSFYNPDIQKFHYGLTLNFGYNTFNIQAYYALNNLLEDQAVMVGDNTINLRPLRIGIIFYIL